MDSLIKDIEVLLAIEAFKSLCSSDVIKIGQLEAAIALLIKACIPFDVSFTPGNRRKNSSISLTIYINPNTTLQFNFTLEGCILTCPTKLSPP